MQTSPITKLTTEGHITLPEETRAFLKIGLGDEVKFFMHPDGFVAMMPVNSMTKLRGIAKYSGKPVTIREMDEGIAKGIVERFGRSDSDK